MKATSSVNTNPIVTFNLELTTREAAVLVALLGRTVQNEHLMQETVGTYRKSDDRFEAKQTIEGLYSSMLKQMYPKHVNPAYQCNTITIEAVAYTACEAAVANAERDATFGGGREAL